MKKNKPKYLKLYYSWLENELPKNGLCQCFHENKLFKMVCPPCMNDKQLMETYWADESPCAFERSLNKRNFNQLRQNLVLLMAALNNEL